MIVGLGFLALAIGAAFLLITDLLFDGARVWIYTGVVWVVIVGPVVRAPAALYRSRRVVRPVGQRGEALARVGRDGARVALGGQRPLELLGDLALALRRLREHGLVDEDRRARGEREVEGVAGPRVDDAAAAEPRLGVEDRCRRAARCGPPRGPSRRP